MRLPQRYIHGISLILGLAALLMTSCAAPFAALRMTPTSTAPSFAATLTPSPTIVLPLTPQAVWGAYHVTHITFPIAANTSFFAADVAPDGSVIAGVYRAANQTQDIAVITVATRQLRLLYALPHDFLNACVQTDGRYVGWAGGNEGEGANDGHEIAGYADLTTGQIRSLADVTDYSIPSVCRVDQGKMIWEHSDTQQQPLRILLTDLAHGATSELHIPEPPSAYQWPYALYLTYNQVTRLTRAHLRNLATGADTTLTAFDQTGDFNVGQYPLTLAGASVFRLVGNTPFGTVGVTTEQLQEIDHADQAGAAMQIVTQGNLVDIPQDFAANDRLVVITRNGAGEVGTILTVWDRVQQRLVTFPSQAGNFLLLRGNMLALAPAANSLDIIDTSQLPPA